MQRFNSARRRRGLGRGFTLIELMAVVIIIGISAALAMPSILDQMRQRNLREAALSIASVYSDARMRALSRGAAVMVQYTEAGGFSVTESIEGTATATDRNAPACANEPGLGCLTNNWTAGGLTSRPVGIAYQPQSQLQIKAADAAGAASLGFSVCFTPLGRSFIGPSPTSATTPMIGSPVFTVSRTGGWVGGYQYYVALLPNGIARMTRGEVAP